MGIWSRHFRGRQIYLLIYIQGYFQGKVPSFIFLPNITNPHTFSKISCGSQSLVRTALRRRCRGKKSLTSILRTTICETFPASHLLTDLEWHSITNHGSLLYVRTNVDAPQHKVITIDLSTGETRDFIPEQKDARLANVKCVNKEYFVVIYKRNVALLAICFLNSPNADMSLTGQR